MLLIYLRNIYISSFKKSEIYKTFLYKCLIQLVYNNHTFISFYHEPNIRFILTKKMRDIVPVLKVPLIRIKHPLCFCLSRQPASRLIEIAPSALDRCYLRRAATNLIYNIRSKRHISLKLQRRSGRTHIRVIGENILVIPTYFRNYGEKIARLAPASRACETEWNPDEVILEAALSYVYLFLASVSSILTLLSNRYPYDPNFRLLLAMYVYASVSAAKAALLLASRISVAVVLLRAPRDYVCVNEIKREKPLICGMLAQ